MPTPRALASTAAFFCALVLAGGPACAQQPAADPSVGERLRTAIELIEQKPAAAIERLEALRAQGTVLDDYV
ncbi:MAG: hypothetical protein D6815_09600, partial [Candidatus Dadabacteria bacterium]